MPTKLFQVDGGLSDGKVYYLAGTGAPGADGDVQDEAPVGSRYVDKAVPVTYQKTTAGSGTDKWAVEVSSGEKVVQTVPQTAHGFAVGDWLYLSASGYAKADGTAVAKSDVIGIIETVPDVNSFTLVTHGMSEVTFTGTTGNALFLDQGTVGGATVTKPETGVQKNLGFIKDNLVFVAIDITIDISDDEPPGVPLIVVDSVTTIEAVDSLIVDEENVGCWLLEASSASGRHVGIYFATHDGFGASDATVASHSAFGEQSVGVSITGLAIGVSLSGAGASQMLDLTVVSTVSVNVRVRRIAA